MLNGGAISEAHKVCNYPSQNNISGFNFAQKMVSHLKELGGEIKQETVKEIKKEKDFFKVITNKDEYEAKNILLATGRKKQKLDIPGEDEFLSRGVSYCATCDAAFYKEKTVAVAGGGNTAVTAALLLTEYAKKIYIIYRGDNFFRVEPAWLKLLEKEKKIETIFGTNIKKIYGDKFVSGMILDNEKNLDVDGVFVEIGFFPDKKFAEQLGVLTDKGYIIVDNFQKTNIDHIFAAGDATNNPLKQAITACAEGAIAATSVYEKLKKENADE